jgi:hypothetical protein
MPEEWLTHVAFRVSYLPNFSSSKSEGDLFGFRHSIAKMPMFTVMQHRKSMMRRRRRMPATAIPTMANDEIFILLSATPITSNPMDERRKHDSVHRRLMD